MSIQELQAKQQETMVSVQVERREEDLFEVKTPDYAGTFQLTWESPSQGWARNAESGEVFPFFLQAQEESVTFWLGGKTYHFTRPVATTRRKGAGDASHPGALSGDVKAPMPGTVLKILVEEGATVEANVPLLIMESMKMEMTLTAPMSGWVSHVGCQVGQLVEMNTVLIKLEPVKDESVIP